MDEVESIRDWLGTSGFRLEAETAQAFREAGLTVLQGLHYEPDEPEARAGREIDVLAVSERLDAAPLTPCTVLFVVECKASRVPWVVFRGHDEASPLGAIGRYPMGVISRRHLLASVDIESELWLLGLPANVGYRVVSRGAIAGGSGEKGQSDPAFTAIQQVVSAAHGILRGDTSGIPTVVVPVLVVGAHLFSVSYDQEGNEEIVPSTWERILWRGSRTSEPVVIDVVPRDHIQAYAQVAAAGAAGFLPILRDASLEARDEESRRAGEDLGPASRAVLGAVSVVDGASQVVARFRRFRQKRSDHRPTK